MTFAARTPTSPAPYESTGGRLVTADGRALPLIGATLAADARGGLVRIALEQTFRNPHDEPLRVTYSLPLPADGAVSGFAFRIGDERVVGQVDTKQQARQRFEDALLEGRTAALLDQERSSLFTQEVGNVPPRTQVVCEVQVDQRLTWLPDGAWEWRFPTVVAPRYLGAAGRVADHASVTVDVADAALPVKLGLSLSIRDALPADRRPESPSHALHTARLEGRTDVTFADERGAGLDRDVVVRWRVATPRVGTGLDVSRPASGPSSEAAYGLLTIVPPAAEAGMTPVARDLIVLLDTSGSMSGSPLEQARRVAAALVDSLTDRDQLELIEFSSAARRWRRGSVPATDANRRDAQGWLARLRASGGTEMRTGILEALAPLRAESQRQVILVTDGLIGFEHEVLEAISQRLPPGSRVHTVGVGSGVNRSLTLPAARAGRGVELVIGLGEDPEPFVQRLLARTRLPLLTDVEVAGSAVLAVAPARVPDLFGGSPALVSLKLRPEGGELVVRARTADGELEDRLAVAPTAHGAGSPAVAALYAREVVEDLELGVATGGDKAGLDRQIERVGLDFQISTRLTSWVALSSRQTVDPRAPRRQETMPQAVPFGMSAEGVGLRPAVSEASSRAGAPPLVMSAAPRPAASGGFALKGASKELAGGSAAMADEERSAEGKPSPSADEAAGSLRPSRRSEDPSPPMSPPRAAPPAPRKKEGLLDLARRLLRPEAPAPAAPAPREQARQARPLPITRLRGKVRRVGGRLVVELDVTAPLQWAPAAEAELELSDGRVVTAPVVAALTTAPGAYALGLTLTLVLEVEASLGEPATVRLSNGGEVVEIVL